ncbi:MAG TPA: class IV adenylate cyclase [Pirellulales bacterium]|nr:class IV adenylate cyclase [Pirellulales bacterium]
MPRNIELKARLATLDVARETARRLATGSLGIERQKDTYFVCRLGRLKLREREGLSAQLVGYTRANDAAPKPSDYHIIEIADVAALRAALSATLGVLVVVDKRREIFLANNVRIHLDQVAELGDFLEFEAVLGPGDGDDDGRAQLAALGQEFGIDSADLVAGSYSDLLLERCGPAR